MSQGSSPRSLSIPDVAVIIPAHNEEGAIGPTIRAVRGLLPGARIYVCDNNSRDGTSEEAHAAGAIVLFEPILGKGNAVRRLLRDVDSDVYVMVDGDNTYDLSFLPAALEDFVSNHYDLMTGNRLSGEHAFMRRGHGMANRLFSQLIQSLLDVKTADVFSGFRLMSRRLIRSFPLFSAEFEIETELTVFAARMRLPIKDFPTNVVKRIGTSSKLNSFVDGTKILLFVLRLLHREYPLRLYFPFAILVLVFASTAFASVYLEFLSTGQVARFPTLFLACFGYIAALLAIFSGMILKEIANIKYESRYHAYNFCGSSCE